MNLMTFGYFVASLGLLGLSGAMNRISKTPRNNAEYAWAGLMMMLCGFSGLLFSFFTLICILSPSK
jgi:hypothetical protein